MEFNEIMFNIENGIATIVLNRPENRNVITSHEMVSEIETACNYVNQDMNLKVLIITGKDPAFSSGGNVKEMAAKKGMFSGTPAQIMVNYKRFVQRIPRAVHTVEVPTIAAVNGAAVGAGCDLALMCDMRIASEKAKFGETFLNVGLIPGDGGAYFLPRVVGMAKACELTFTGDLISADEALKIGLVNNVVAHDDLMKKTIALAEKIASKPPEALRMAKKLIYMGQYMQLPELLEQSASFQALCHNTQDHFEALNAMFEKRQPIFKGR
ncbi:MAG: crotonase/enoyl-CoA hydratase family protein [Proteobacteria bacterium]|nr:crotonase/enoyl-CoA hydratase family protein [Pseudomonadota bacterium]